MEPSTPPQPMVQKPRVQPAQAQIDGRGILEDLSVHPGSPKCRPAESPREIFPGMILVRNRQWSVAARVMDRLQSSGTPRIKRLQHISGKGLLEILRPVGSQKAKMAFMMRFANEISEKWNGHGMPF